MKVTLLIANCNTRCLERSVETVINVLKELDVEIHKVDLYGLPYFTGTRSKELDVVIKTIEESKGVIAISSVPMLSMHGAMQSFFENASLYNEVNFSKPMLAITYSEWLGEVEAADRMLKNWNILGGIEGNKICFTNNADFAEVTNQLEKEIETFYRLMKQERKNLGCSERLIYRAIKQGNILNGQAVYTARENEEIKQERKVEIKDFVSMLKADQENKNVIVNEREESLKMLSKEQGHIDLSTKEQTIKEISSLLSEQKEDEFISMNTGIYRKPAQNEIIRNKRIQQIPHYFVAQYDKALKVILKYQITDLNEEGYIVIQNGDCVYMETIDELPTVELILTDEVLKEVLTKHMTYQKAFMLGKLKVRGNFAVLPKLDQIFKSI